MKVGGEGGGINYGEMPGRRLGRPNSFDRVRVSNWQLADRLEVN